jgi:hypothetical protein
VAVALLFPEAAFPVLVQTSEVSPETWVHETDPYLFFSNQIDDFSYPDYGKIVPFNIP